MMMKSGKMSVKTVLVAAVGMTASVTCVGATESVGSLARIEGSAVVSQGAQYVKAHEGMPLNTGDRLMVMDGGKAILSFKDGCQYTLGDNEVLTIGTTSACAAQGAGSYKVDPRTAVSSGKDSLALQPAAMGAVTTAGSTLLPTGAAVAGFAGIGLVTAAGLDTGSDNAGAVSP